MWQVPEKRKNAEQDVSQTSQDEEESLSLMQSGIT